MSDNTFSNSQDETSTDVSDESVKLLGSSEKSGYRSYWYRWYVCMVFAMFGMFQGAIWNTWSPINESAKVALGFTSGDITLLTNWGPIAFMIAMPVYMWLMDNKGLRVTVGSGAFLVALGSALRCLPLDIHTFKYVTHVGQFLNGISGCPVMAVPPLLSNVWFPPHERVTATGIATLFNYFGTGLAFIIGPLFVQQPSNKTKNISCLDLTALNNDSCKEIYRIRKQIQHVMYFEFGVALFLFIAIMIFFPKKPPTPPSVSASMQRLNLKEGLLQLRFKGRYWIAATVGGLVVGTWGGWAGVMNILLKPLDIAQDESDFMGFVTTLTGCAIGIVIGWITDRIKGRMKAMVVTLMTITFVMFLYFVIIANRWLKFPPFLPGSTEIWIIIVVVGITTNAAVPVLMEMSADSAYPVNEGTSTAILVWLMNVLSFVFLLILNISSDVQFANFVMLGCFAVSVPMLVFGTKEINQRLEMDSENTKPLSNAILSSYGSTADCNVNTKPNCVATDDVVA